MGGVVYCHNEASDPSYGEIQICSVHLWETGTLDKSFQLVLQLAHIILIYVMLLIFGLFVSVIMGKGQLLQMISHFPRIKYMGIWNGEMVKCFC